MPQTAVPPESGLRSAVRNVWAVNWHEIDDRRALRCLPGIAIPLLVGMSIHDTTAGLLGAAGAVSVGFGAVQQIYGSRFTPLMLATVFVPLSAFVGIFVGNHDFAIIAAAAAWGFACGLATAIGQGAVYVGIQSVVFLMVATAFPGNLHTAAEVAGALLLGAALQTAIITIMRLVWGAAVRRRGALRISGIRRGASLAVHTVRRAARRRSEAYRHAIRLGAAMAVSTAIARATHSPHSYWMPMTTVIIIQPGLDQTFTRAISRVAGTIFGAGAATEIAAKAHPTADEVMALIVVFAWLSYSFLRVNYVIAAAFITAYVVFLLAFVGLPAASVTGARIEFTALGALIALLAYAIRGRTVRPLAA